jgi:hypothetical protein
MTTGSWSVSAGAAIGVRHRYHWYLDLFRRQSPKEAFADRPCGRGLMVLARANTRINSVDFQYFKFCFVVA